MLANSARLDRILKGSVMLEALVGVGLAVTAFAYHAHGVQFPAGAIGNWRDFFEFNSDCIFCMLDFDVVLML